MPNLTTLVARVRFLIDEPTAQNFTDTDIIQAINFSQQDVAKEITHIYEDYFEKQAALNPVNGVIGTGGTIPGTEFYTLPADFLKFKRIERADTGEPITPIDQNEKAWNSQNLTSVVQQNAPLSYYVTGNSVGFNPIPATVIPITLTYVYRLSDLNFIVAGVTDISDIPAEHHDMIAIRAAIDMFIKDQEDTTALDNRWNFLLDQLHRTLRQRQIQAPKRVRRVESGDGILY